MARLSINDLNNLSGVSDDKLDNLYKCFRSAHTRLLSRIVKWSRKYAKEYSRMKDYDNYRKYKTARRLYYSGTMILDDVDIFMEYLGNYVSLLSALRKHEDIKNVRMIGRMLEYKKRDIVDFLPSCYEIWNEAYNILYEEE